MGRSRDQYPREYSTWSAMHQRCRNPNNNSYKHYGNNGVCVCARWSKFSAFIEDMGEKPEGDYSIERIDSSLGYEPSNCIWATRKQQNNNTNRNRVIEYNGESKTVTQWAEQLGIKANTLEYRILRGWDIERAMTWDSNCFCPTKSELIAGRAAELGVHPVTVKRRELM